MSVLLHTNTKMSLCEDGLLICPISCQPMMMVNYPIPDFRKMDPISYGHMMGKVVKDGIKQGQLIFSDSNTSEKILWFPMHKAYNVHYKLDWIEDGLKTMAKNRLHDKYEINFPAIGYYEEDGVSQEDVLELVIEYLSDGKFDVKYITHY